VSDAAAALGLRRPRRAADLVSGAQAASLGERPPITSVEPARGDERAPATRTAPAPATVSAISAFAPLAIAAVAALHSRQSVQLLAEREVNPRG